jgi:hypothetical protein
LTAYFVLSTGRCGTQWLAETLPHWSSHFVVQHEPIHFQYRPDLNHPDSPLKHNAERLSSHLDFIRKQIHQGYTYIETGFPCWRHLGWFKAELGKVKVIHIHRDPLESVVSLLKLNAFIPAVLPHLPVKNLYQPGYSQDLLSSQQELWPLLSPAEKNLWYWAEVQHQARQYQQNWPKSDWLSLRFSALFSPQSQQQLAAFLGVKGEPYWPAQQKVDQFGLAALPQQLQFPLLGQSGAIIQLAKQLGYASPFANNS